MVIKKYQYLISLIFLATIFSWSSLAYGASGTPTIFGYQGRLTNASGDLLGGSATTYYFKFSIWDNSTVGSGTKLWPSGSPTSVAATVRYGVFNVNIGDTANGYPDALDMNFNTNKDIYLQVEASANGSSFETLDPRQRISSAVFAQIAGKVSGTGQSSFGTTTPIGNSIVSAESTSNQSIGMTIRGFLGQIANLFQIQDSNGSNLFVVDKSGNVGVGTSTPYGKLSVTDTNSVPQLIVSYDNTRYGQFYTDSVGDVQLSSTGKNFRMLDENLWVCSGGSCGDITPSGQGNAVVEKFVIFDNKFKFGYIDASTTAMYDSANNKILEFDEAQ
ncbi:MAG: hypothetical protein WCW56_03185 [Candidatus Paceibacterota bacterium]|jgi:hypothetical protein